MARTGPHRHMTAIISRNSTPMGPRIPSLANVLVPDPVPDDSSIIQKETNESSTASPGQMGHIQRPQLMTQELDISVLA